MRTVFTPEALNRSVTKGTYKTCRLDEWKSVDGDEMFLFVYPSPDPFSQVNGDGEFLEILDFAPDLSEVDTDMGTIKTAPETLVYYRPFRE